jgi:hypothetical protein
LLSFINAFVDITLFIAVDDPVATDGITWRGNDKPVR